MVIPFLFLSDKSCNAHVIQFWSMIHNGKSSWQLLKETSLWDKKRETPEWKVLFLLPVHSFRDHGCGKTWYLKLNEPSYNHKVKTYRKKVRIRNIKIGRAWVPNDILEPLLQTLELPASKILLYEMIKYLHWSNISKLSFLCVVAGFILTAMDPKYQLDHNTSGFQISCFTFLSACLLFW